MNPSLRRGAAALLPALALIALAGGCNHSGLVEASGRLTYQGKPVPGTRVYFQPDDGSRRSTGLTDDDGNFKLRFSSQETGVKPGAHTVYLRYEPSAEEEIHKIPPKAPRELQAVIARFGDPKKSGLRYEITGSGQHVEIELK
jgi:hypothetical protein